MAYRAPLRARPRTPARALRRTETGENKHVRHASLLISFSGLDGAGKSTQIQGLCDLLARLGYKTNLRAFWDHVVVLSRWREGFVHKAYGSERGVGAPGQPVARRDKNVRRRYLT